MKDCRDRRDYYKRYYQEHKDINAAEKRRKARASWKKWYLKPENKAKRSEYFKGYYEDNKDSIKVKQKEAYQLRKLDRYYEYIYSS